MSADRARRYARAPDATLKPVGDGVAIYLRSRRALHVLNPTARALFEYLEEPASLAEFVSLFEQLTDGDAETIESDLRAALDRFVELGIVVPVE